MVGGGLIQGWSSLNLHTCVCHGEPLGDVHVREREKEKETETEREREREREREKTRSASITEIPIWPQWL